MMVYGWYILWAFFEVQYGTRESWHVGEVHECDSRCTRVLLNRACRQKSPVILEGVERGLMVQAHAGNTVYFCSTTGTGLRLTPLAADPRLGVNPSLGVGLPTVDLVGSIGDCCWSSKGSVKFFTFICRLVVAPAS